MSYKNFYRMQAEAFGSLPVLNLFYNSGVHRDGWRYLVDGVSGREPFLLVTGDYGMGKTLLSIMLVRLMEKRRSPVTVAITDPHRGFAGIVQKLAGRFGVDPSGLDESGLLNSFYRVLEGMENIPPISILVDDAQELGAEALVKLRALANFSRAGYFPIQLIFFAHPDFCRLLELPQLAALGQRIKRRHRLTPLTLQETKEYIYFRLYKSGAPGTPSFTEDALQEIHISTGGIPRLINNICDAALALGAARQENVIGRETVQQARSEAAGGAPSIPPPPAREPVPAMTAPPLSIRVPLEQQEPPAAAPQPSAAAAAVRLWQRPRMKAYLAGACIAAVLLIRLLAYQEPERVKKHDAAAAAAAAAQESPAALASSTASSTAAEAAAPPDSLPAGSAAAARDNAPAAPADSAPQDSAPAEPGGSAAASPQPDNDSAGVKNEARQNIEKPAPGAGRSETGDRQARRPFTIRLASYNTQESAKTAAAHFSGMNLTPIMVKVRFQQEAWWILYLGAFPTNEMARAALASCGLPAAEVLPMPYAIKTGTFASREKAAGEQERLERLGIYSYAVRCDGSGETALFTGAFNSRELAKAELKELSGRGISGTVSYLATPGDSPDSPAAEQEALRP